MAFVSAEQKILLDVGSYTIKVYKKIGEKLDLFLTRSMPVEQGFDPEGGVSEPNKKELFELLKAIKAENKDIPIKIYATALWRRLTPETKRKLIDEIFERTGLYFNIIDQDLENFYLEVALVGKCHITAPILLINIGGGSGELAVMYGTEAVERANIDFGAGDINSKFPSINNQISGVKIEDLVAEIKTKLPPLKNKPKIAFYTGGELTYMKLVKYPLVKNELFEDSDHPLAIYTKDFAKKNKEIFEQISLETLKSLMPQDPKWMLGARACSAIVQAICEKYGIEIIIPSDSNTINGVVRQEFRYVTLSGNFKKHLDYILEVKRFLESKGTEILSPKIPEPKNAGEDLGVFAEEEKTPLQLERYHLSSIEKSDALIVCNPEGYVGTSTILEIGYANALSKRIIFTEKPKEPILNTLPAEIGL